MDKNKECRFIQILKDRSRVLYLACATGIGAAIVEAL